MSAINELRNIAQEENSAVGVTNLNQWVLRKVEAEGYENLTMEEKVIIHVHALDWEISNHGINRLIFGSDIRFAEEMAECLRRIGAQKTATYFDELVSRIPNWPLPEDKDEREAYFKSLDDEDIQKLDIGIRKLSTANEDLFTGLCNYFDSIRERLAYRTSE